MLPTKPYKKANEAPGDQLPGAVFSADFRLFSGLYDLLSAFSEPGNAAVSKSDRRFAA